MLHNYDLYRSLVMSCVLQRRASKWYENLIFSGYCQFLLGYLFIVCLPVVIRYPNELMDLTLIAIHSIAVISAAYAVFFLSYRAARDFHGAQSLGYQFALLAFIWLLALAVLLLSRLEYARQVLITSYLLANFWLILSFYLRRKYRVMQLAVVPGGRAKDLSLSNLAHLEFLTQPNLNNKHYDALVADLHSADLSPVWTKFIAQCVLERLPVFHVKQVQEALTGKVQLEHLNENEFGALLPSGFYLAIKRWIDTFAVFILAPFIILIILIAGIAIKLESKGPVFFIQTRVGFGNRLFKIYKLRSMYIDKAGKEFTTSVDDPRITKVGKVIRKYRIDELPQLLNILKGEMSFIGPRPESEALAACYEKEIPFFSYRHVVRPGISGWAQVTQGYAAEVNGMTQKLEYDFYYIKHFSLSLDILIFFKTIKTLLTGFGAR